MRLIDANRLLQGYEDHDFIDTHIIYNAPTVDAEPVRHGKWDKGTDSDWHICEECGAEVDISMGTGVWVKGVELYELKYCPYCGAKMDEEDDDETD